MLGQIKDYERPPESYPGLLGRAGAVLLLSLASLIDEAARKIRAAPGRGEEEQGA